MQRFDPKQFYKLKIDPKIKDNNFVVSPYPKGLFLMTEYYADKYDTKITIPNYEVPEGPDAPRSTKASLFEGPDLDAAVAKINNIKGGVGDYREAFLLNVTKSHAVPLVYLRENGKEGLLIADSIGTAQEFALTSFGINAETGLKVLTITDKRQVDEFSCYTDSLTFGRDCTAKLPDGTYRIPDLLKSLESRESKVFIQEGEDPNNLVHTHYSTLLPNELLKAPQLSKFMKDNFQQDRADQPIHKGQITDEFRARYTEEAFVRRDEKDEFQLREINTYLRKKGFKNADIMEIQFYLNEFSRLVGKITMDDRDRFIKLAKIVFAEQGPIVPDKPRAGLYELAQGFLANLTAAHALGVSPEREEKENAQNRGPSSPFLFKTGDEKDDSSGMSSEPATVRKPGFSPGESSGS